MQFLIALCQQNMTEPIDPKVQLTSYIRTFGNAQKSGDPNLVAYAADLLNHFIDGIEITVIEPGTKVEKS